jgi:hypothetical protein
LHGYRPLDNKLDLRPLPSSDAAFLVLGSTVDALSSLFLDTRLEADLRAHTHRTTNAFELFGDHLAELYAAETVWTRHKNAVPFNYNDAMLEALAMGVIVFPGSGIVENLADKVRKMGIQVWRFELS